MLSFASLISLRVACGSEVFNQFLELQIIAKKQKPDSPRGAQRSCRTPHPTSDRYRQDQKSISVILRVPFALQSSFHLFHPMQKPHWSFKHTGTGIRKEQGSEKDEEPKEKPKDKDTAHETPAFNHKETSC